ncbi:MAG: DUF2927 domain-containing protein [Alphaproteobacteria bacterium]
MLRLARLALPLLVLVAADAAAQGRNAWPSPPILVRQFERVAFSSEFGGQYRAGRLIRWDGPITVRITGHAPDRFRIEVERQLSELRQLSGLAIDFAAGTAEGAAPTMTIEFSNSRGGTTFDPKAPCRTLLWETGFAIRRVQIYIAPYPDELRRHCIAEELTQALGLADDSPLVRDSIFNDASSRQRIAPWDALMVRILYDPRLKPGMHRTEAMLLARRIIAEQLTRNGTSSSRPR